MEITIYDHQGTYIGEAASFGEARRLQKAALPEELRVAYAGVGQEGQPLFYEDALPETTQEAMVPGF